MQRHSGQYDFVCTFCKKGYTMRKTYNQHLMQVHKLTEDLIRRSVNPCKDCNNLNFKTPVKFINHREAVHDGIVFICDKCGKAFSNKIILQSHQKYHKGEKTKK